WSRGPSSAEQRSAGGAGGGGRGRPSPPFLLPPVVKRLTLHAGQTPRARATDAGEDLYSVEQPDRGVEGGPRGARTGATSGRRPHPLRSADHPPFHQRPVLGKVRPMSSERALQKPGPGDDLPGDGGRDAAGLKLPRAATPPREARPWG